MSKAVEPVDEPETADHGTMTKQSGAVAPDWSGKFSRLGGSTSDDWNTLVSDQTVATVWFGNPDDRDRTPEMIGQRQNAAYAFLMRQHLKDELEAMMAAQLFAAHNAAMECYRRAMIPQQPMQARSENLNQANKLSRTYATMIEALNRHRGKSSQQKVTVEHVHVYEGGQAVVGMVAPQAGGGVASISKGQSHAKQDDEDASYAPNPALLGQDPLGNVLPIAGHAERPVSHARRREPRRAKG